MTIRLRNATLRDANELKAIARRVIRVSYVPFIGAANAHAFIESGMADKEIDDNINECDIITAENICRGFTIIKANMLHLLMVDVPHQRKGYGTALLAHAEKKIFSKHTTAALQSFVENERAIRFYIKNGWKCAREEHVPEMNLRMAFFEKRLT